MRVRVDSKRCSGHGRCYDLAPAVYREDEDGRCLLAVERVPPEHEEQARLGERNCPERAIETLES